MPIYRYTGANKFGRRVKGEILADNPLELQQRLRAANIDILTYKEKKQGFQFIRKKRLRTREVITITTQFRQLLRAGVPLMEILDDLKNTYESDGVREVLSNIYESMEGGDSFSQALAPYESDFGKVYVSLVEVGEKTGQLEQILLNMENMLKWEEMISSKAKKVMIYPAIVATVVLGVIFMMMIFVVPQLLTFINEMGGEIGMITKSLLVTSEFFQHYWLHVLVTPVLLYFLFKFMMHKYDRFKLKVDEWVFKFPLFGAVLFKLKVARMTNSLAVMYRAGVGFTDSMKLAATVSNNSFIQANMNRAQRLIEDGTPIHESFKEANVVPPMAIRMIKVGELSGNMDESLTNVSDFYDTEAKDLIDKIEPAIEPLLTVVMAIVVGWVMLAILGPVYDTISQVR